MDVKNPQIAQAAIDLIMRYGVRKVTMNDLAAAAGVSRQTIYNTYAGKEDVVRDAMRLGNHASLMSARDGWTKADTLADKLDVFFQSGPIAWFDMISHAPDAADLVDGINTIGGAEIAQAEGIWKAELSSMLTPFNTAFEQQNLHATDVAEMVFETSKIGKTSATDRADLLRRLSTLKAAVVALART